MRPKTIPADILSLCTRPGARADASMPFRKQHLYIVVFIKYYTDRTTAQQEMRALIVSKCRTLCGSSNRARAFRQQID